MARFRSLVVAIAAIAVVTACGDPSPSIGSGPTMRSSDTLPAAESEMSPALDGMSATPSLSDAPTVEAGPVAANPVPAQTVELDQPVIWPAPDVVFDTPEQAAASFVSDVLGVEPVLGDFMGGDSRSGEIQVFSPGDGGGDPADRVERGLLGLRIIGPNDGWFVIAANSQGVQIETPETLDRIPAGPLVVSGRGRGFEGTLVVSAFRSGDAGDVLDQVITSGGAFESLEPFSATLDLSDGAPGDVVALLVRGDTGLEGDPGEFASMPVVIDDPLPETR